MNVAVVFPRANRQAGVERVAWDLSNGLAHRHRVTFVGFDYEQSDENDVIFHKVAPSFGLPSPFDFRRSAQRALTILSPDVTISLGVQCPAGDIGWVQSVHRAYLNQGIGAVVRGRSVPGWVRWLLPRHRLLLLAERSYFKSEKLRRAMCTSARERQDVATIYGVDPERCVTVPVGYDPMIFDTRRADAIRESVRRALGMSDNAISFLFVANELHRKGFGTLIEAFARADLAGARLDVVGQVDPGDYKSRVSKLGIGDKIFWHGPTTDVFGFYAAADVMVFPTRYEPFGLVVVEALACGLPVIASRLAGASSAVQESGAGLILDDPTDSEELARCLLAAADGHVRATWAAKAPAAAQPFAWPQIIAQVERILEAVALERNQSGA